MIQKVGILVQKINQIHLEEYLSVLCFCLDSKRDSDSSLDEDVVDAPMSMSSPMDEWETKVVVAFNVTRVDVTTNLGNVMGQAMCVYNIAVIKYM